MSDSEDLSSAANIPADAEIEQCIRTIVREAVKRDEAVTVNLARTRAEEKLGLDAGFLKDNAQWKRRSKDLVNAAFEEPPSPEVSKTKPAPKAGTKRKSDELQPSRKKARKNTVDDSEDEAVDSASDRSDDRVESEGSEDKPTNGKAKQDDKRPDESVLSDPPDDDEPPKTKRAPVDAAEDDESELSSVIDDPPPKKKRQNPATTKASTKAKPAKPAKAAKAKPKDKDDESDMSSVIDEPPPKKGRKKKSTSPKPKAKAPANKSLSADEEEIKRLQSWLLKCGIRKLWHRELAPFDTDKAKIKHLKSMLEEAGMTGRPSAEKAKQIKEARELKAELDAATEFNKTWGHDSDAEDDEDEDGEDVGGRAKEKEEEPVPGKRARPKGFVDFGDSDEESE